MKLLKGFLMVIGGLTLVVFIAAILFGRGENQQVTSSDEVENFDTTSASVPQESVPSSLQTNTTIESNLAQTQRQNALTEATLTYWKSWKSLRERYAVAAKPLSEVSIENSIALSSLNMQLADQLSGLPAIDVDEGLIEVAANAITLYRDNAKLFQTQANILSKWNTFVEKRDSDTTAGAQVLVFLFNENDRFAVSRALADEANQIKSEWNNNLILLQQNEQNIKAMVAQRDGVRIKLESRYGVVFENE